MKIRKENLIATLERAKAKLSKAAIGQGKEWQPVWEVVGQIERVLELAKPKRAKGEA